MLRITHSGSQKLTTVDLDGKLLGPWVDELRSVTAKLNGNEVVRLNLARLSFADQSGIALLQELSRGGVELFGCSLLIAGLLASHRAAAGQDAAYTRARDTDEGRRGGASEETRS